ncbi:MAG: hypothetical protein ACRDZ3_13340 [Acidimicrobiia bacterium]
MRTSIKTPGRIVSAAAMAVVLAVTLAGPALAHSDGRVQLWVDRLALQPGAGIDWTLTVDMVDADSGTPQPGFDVAVEGRDEAGHSFAPVLMTDAGRGRYTAQVAADPGRWSMDLRGDSLPGGTPGVPLRKSYSMVLEAGKDLTIETAASPGGGSGSGGIGSGVLVGAVFAVVVGAGLILARRRRPRMVDACVGRRPGQGPPVAER